MEQAIASESPAPAAVTLLNPDWTGAIERHRQGDAEGAIAAYQRHLERHPQDAAAWLNLGAALRRSGRADAALVCYQRMLRLRPLDACVWSNLGNLWRELGQHEQALRNHRRAVELAPRELQLRINLAAALGDAGRLEDAETAWETCLGMCPGRPDLLWERAQLLLHAGRHAEAWVDLDARFGDAGPQLPVPATRRWAGERIGGKYVLLQAERRMTETLWSIRYLRMLFGRGADLTLLCPPELHPLLGGLPVRPVSRVDAHASARGYDFHAHLMSLPPIVDPRGLAIPEPLPLAIPESARQRMRALVQGQTATLRIGIAWADAEDADGGASAGPGLARFLPLAALPGVQLFSLQQGGAAADITRLGAGGFTVDLGARCADLGDAAAAIDSLDLLITTDNALAHLAGSLGKPMLNLLRHKPHWIHGMRRDASPWYPSMRLLRQKSAGDWDSVFREVLQLVGRWAAQRAGALR